MSQSGTDQGPSPFSSAPVSAPPPFAGAGSPPPPPAYAPTIGGHRPAVRDGAPPPRPAVPVGSAMLVAGGAMLLLAPVFAWYTYRTTTVSGYSGVGYPDAPNGTTFAVVGVLAIGFGLVQLFARRLVAVAVAAIVTSAVGLVLVLDTMADLADRAAAFEQIDVRFVVGHGPLLALLGCAVSLAGGVTTLARRRRWPAPVCREP